MRRLGYINREWISKNSEHAEVNMVRKRDDNRNTGENERYIEMWGDERKEKRRGSLEAGMRAVRSGCVGIGRAERGDGCATLTVDRGDGI